jgi:hypothetical protein
MFSLALFEQAAAQIAAAPMTSARYPAWMFGHTARPAVHHRPLGVPEYVPSDDPQPHRGTGI